MLSPAVGNLISTSTDVVPDGMQHVLMTGETADDHRQRPWRQLFYAMITGIPRCTACWT